MCSCGSVHEDPPHFIFDYPRYVEQRRILLIELSEFEPLNAELVLYGNSDLSIGQNIRIALYNIFGYCLFMHRYIISPLMIILFCYYIKLNCYYFRHLFFYSIILLIAIST